MVLKILEISYNASYVKNSELENSKVYFIALASKIFDLFINIIAEVESIIRNKYNIFRNNKFDNIDVENMTIAIMILACAQNDIKLDIQQIDELIKRTFPDEKDNYMNKKSIERQ